jgi:hypothetical protein
VRQLLRAHRAGALAWDELLVVDRDSSCAVSSLDVDDRPPRLRLVASEWDAFFAQYLSSAAQDDHRSTDAIVPSPLMPHLMADWLLARARARWPERAVGIGSIETLPSIPWQRSGDDGTRYVSFAEWICPINCIEPARCPETRGPRSWSLPAALAAASDRGEAHHRGSAPLSLYAPRVRSRHDRRARRRGGRCDDRRARLGWRGRVPRRHGVTLPRCTAVHHDRARKSGTSRFHRGLLQVRFVAVARRWARPIE